MTVQTLWLVRHGESVGNIAATEAETLGREELALEYRDADTPLSATGAEQARALGEWLDDRLADIGAIWVSPYERAQQTLAIALGERPAQVVVDERLRDRELGILDGLTRLGVHRRHPEEAERRRRLGKYYHRPPGGESWADVSLRLRSFLRDALATPADSGLVVAHDAVIMLLMGLLLRMSERDLLDFADGHTVLNASVTRLDRDGDGWRLVAFSDVAHLRREGADVTVHAGDPDVEPE
jgi:2,3-bisphosphoglycerate-dependent phosphoglycerate mutase